MPAQSNSNSGSEEDPYQMVDQRKRKRMISNRDSARRSRMRKQKHLDDLGNQITQLKTENTEIATKINLTIEYFLKLETENTVLRSQVMELTQKLQSLNSVLHFMEEFSGLAMDIPEIPDPLLKPWQLTCPSLPIMASPNIFQY